MSRHSSGKRKKGGRGLRGVGAFVVALLGAAGGLLYACRPDRMLEQWAAPDGSAGKGKPVARKGAAPSPHLELGTPEDGDPKDDLLVIKPQYALSYNPDRNIANWVSWQLEASWFGDAPRHKGKFLEDSELPAGVYRVKHDDYTGSGYDRGHMVRSEERTRSPEDNKTTFFLTNILPQTHDLNAGPWLRLEEHCEARSRRQGRTLYVVAGGVLPRDGKRGRTIGKGVTVPDTFFKIVVELGPGEGAADVRANAPVIAVLMPNDTGIMGEDWEKYRTTVDEIEKRTGYDFLTAIDPSVESMIEARRE